MKIRHEIQLFESRLRARAHPERAEGEKRYLKSDFDFLGVSTPEIRNEVATWLRAHPDLERRDLIRLVKALFSRRIHELKAIAIVLLQKREKLLAPEDIDILEAMLRRSYTWAYVDAIAVHVAGPLVERNPQLRSRLDEWSRDSDLWIRRSAMLALLLPLRAGRGDWERFAGYADRMLDEREFFIRKAIGWVLREVGKRHPKRVSRFLEQRIDRVSGVSLREAVKYLEPDDRVALMRRAQSRTRGGKTSPRREISAGAA